MIVLRAAAVWAPNGRPILTPTTEVFSNQERIGILAAPGSGKTTLARIFAGIDQPQNGRVFRTGMADTILGQENLLHPYMSINAALDSAATFLGLPARPTRTRCLRFAGSVSDPNAWVSTLSPVQKSTLAFALSLQRAGQWMIADDRLLPNDPVLAPAAEVALRVKLRSTGLIYLTKNATQLSRFCSRFFVLARASLIPVSDSIEAAAILRVDQKERA